ncbi:alpha/beta hydrolase [soil metagenome]
MTPQVSSESADNELAPTGSTEPNQIESSQTESREAKSLNTKKTKPNKFHWKEIVKAVVQLYILYAGLGVLLLFVFKDAAVLHPMDDVSWKPQLTKLDTLFKTKSRELKIPLPIASGDQANSAKSTDKAESLAALLVEKPSNKIILVSHGNAGNIGHRVGLSSLLVNSGASVLLYDYQGFGESDGNATCANALSDGLTAYDYVVNNLHYKPENIIIYGESVGCGVTTHIMKNRKAGKVILQSGFTSLLNAARDKLFFLWVLPPNLVPEPNFDNLAAVQEAHPPILFIHGDKDTILPVSYCETMYSKALAPKQIYICHGEGHNDIGLKDAAGFVGAIKKFVNEK